MLLPEAGFMCSVIPAPTSICAGVVAHGPAETVRGRLGITIWAGEDSQRGCPHRSEDGDGHWFASHLLKGVCSWLISEAPGAPGVLCHGTAPGCSPGGPEQAAVTSASPPPPLPQSLQQVLLCLSG